MQHVKRQPEVAQIDELYRKNAPTVLSFVRRQVGSLEEAEDIVLEVFIAALESQTVLKLEEQKQQAWLHRVAHNKCIDHYRQAKRKPTISLELLVENIYADDEHEPEKVATRQEEYNLLRKNLLQLTEQQRTILQLKFGNNLHSPEIARQLNKSESAIRMMLARTLNFLRDIYMSSEERGQH